MEGDTMNSALIFVLVKSEQGQLGLRSAKYYLTVVDDAVFLNVEG